MTLIYEIYGDMSDINGDEIWYLWSLHPKSSRSMDSNCFFCQNEKGDKITTATWHKKVQLNYGNYMELWVSCRQSTSINCQMEDHGMGQALALGVRQSSHDCHDLTAVSCRVPCLRLYLSTEPPLFRWSRKRCFSMLVMRNMIIPKMYMAIPMPCTGMHKGMMRFKSGCIDIRNWKMVVLRMGCEACPFPIGWLIEGLAALHSQ